MKGGGSTKRHVTKKETFYTAGPGRMWLHCLAYCRLQFTGLSDLFRADNRYRSGLRRSRSPINDRSAVGVGLLLVAVPWMFADRYNAGGWAIMGSSILGGFRWITAGSLPVDAYASRYETYYSMLATLFHVMVH